MVFFASIFLTLAPISFALGIVLPLVRFESFYFFDETPSLIGIVGTLVEGGDYLLAILVACFSILFPIVKQFAVTFEAFSRGKEQPAFLSKLVPILSKWSMMDVLLVAIVIVAAKTSGMANAFSQPGLWFYAASALLTILAHQAIKRL